LLSNRTGTLTISTNGNRVLYLASFGKWRNVIICDKSTDTEYYYNNSTINAVIQPGVKTGLVSMSLLPMPGVGYDFYPMFQSYKPSSTGQANADMATIGSVTGVANNVIQDMLYQDTLVDVKQGSPYSIISRCERVVPERPTLALEEWDYSKYRLVGSVPVAGSIDYVDNASADGTWPPKAIVKDGEVRYKLLSATASAMPSRQYDLRTYLPPTSIVADARQPGGPTGPVFEAVWATNPTSYYYDPQGGTLDEQSVAAIRAGVNRRSVPPDIPPLPLLAKGLAAPDFSVVDAQGNTVKLSDYSGHVVLLDFWATWCVPCQESMPVIQKIASKYANDGVITLSINTWDTKAAFDAWLPAHRQFTGLSIVRDTSSAEPDSIAYRLYSTNCIPTQYVISRQGKIVAGFLSYKKDESNLENAVKSALSAGG
jgi:thiol-disulfide isomerase/thioredoxin